MHPFSAIYKIALIVDKCVIVDFYIPALNRKILFDSCVLRFCDIHVFIISYFDLSVNMLYILVLERPLNENRAVCYSDYKKIERYLRKDRSNFPKELFII